MRIPAGPSWWSNVGVFWISERRSQVFEADISGMLGVRVRYSWKTFLAVWGVLAVWGGRAAILRLDLLAGPVDPEIDEHFRRSLGKDYQQLFAATPPTPAPSTDSDGFSCLAECTARYFLGFVIVKALQFLAAYTVEAPPPSPAAELHIPGARVVPESSRIPGGLEMFLSGFVWLRTRIPRASFTGRGRPSRSGLTCSKKCCDSSGQLHCHSGLGICKHSEARPQFATCSGKEADSKRL
ncbi:hypothetical protein C7M84_022425 [Penaeus vannamei]|uniref:Uncharacterized protein n=1 Tax=Penaeus vannamei TaxID=6689 RepID=A0A3R7QZ68_PENVA|nr:hypothetical protein C7M84_022425 [Penaeus vannamei]